VKDRLENLRLCMVYYVNFVEYFQGIEVVIICWKTLLLLSSCLILQKLDRLLPI